MESKIKCGVLGAGWWGTFAHIPALLSHPRAELVAIQNQDYEKACRVAADFAIPHACASANELLSIEGLQAVVVSSSPKFHFEQASAALRMGKHVLVEKPMSITAQQARELLDIAKERNVQLLISCPWHYTPHATAARRLIADGAIGKVRMISVLMTNPVDHLLRGHDATPTYGAPYMLPRTETYSDPEIAGGGQIYAQVCHVASYLTFLTGLRASEVFARFHCDSEPVDIYDVLNLRMEDNTIVSIASTGATSTELRTHEVRIFGTGGIIYLELWGGTMTLTRMSGETISYPDLEPGQVYPHQAPALNLIDSILDPGCNGSPASLGVAAMEIIEGACMSVATRHNVLISSIQEQLATTVPPNI